MSLAAVPAAQGCWVGVSPVVMLPLQVRQYAPDDLKFVIEDITDGDPQKVGVKWCVPRRLRGAVGGCVGGWVV